MANVSIRKSISIYEKILKKAWTTTWRHKELWFLGLLTGLLYSGTIIQNVLSSITSVRPANTINIEQLEQSGGSIPYLVTYGSSLVQLPTNQLIITASAFLILAAGIVYLLIISQHMLLESIHRSARRKKHMTAAQIWKTRKGIHFWRLFAVNALILIATALTTTLSSIPLTLTLSNSPTINFLAYLAFYLIVLPILFTINVLGMFSLVHVVRQKDGIDRAISRAFRVLKHHWLSAAELALILFLVNGLVYLAFIITGFVVAAIVAPFFIGAIGLGSLILMSFIGLMAFVAIAILYLFTFGGLTVFNYAVWTEFVERVERYGLMPTLEGFLRKLLK